MMLSNPLSSPPSHSLPPSPPSVLLLLHTIYIYRRKRACHRTPLSDQKEEDEEG